MCKLPPLSEESDVGSEVSIGLEPPLLLVCGGVLLSKSSELSDIESSNQMFNNDCSLATCWSLYMSAINWTIVTLQNERCEHDIKCMSNLSILIVNKFQTTWFCIEIVFNWLRWPTPTSTDSGMCNILRNSSKQLLTLSHCSNESVESFSRIFFMWSTTARIARTSLNETLLTASNEFKSWMVRRPTSVRIIISMENKHSTGSVKFTRIRMSLSIIVWSFTFTKNGNRSVFTFWPMARRNVRNVLSSHVNLKLISLSTSETVEMYWWLNKNNRHPVDKFTYGFVAHHIVITTNTTEWWKCIVDLWLWINPIHLFSFHVILLSKWYCSTYFPDASCAAAE